MLVTKHDQRGYMEISALVLTYIYSFPSFAYAKRSSNHEGNDTDFLLNEIEEVLKFVQVQNIRN